MFPCRASVSDCRFLFVALRLCRYALSSILQLIVRRGALLLIQNAFVIETSFKVHAERSVQSKDVNAFGKGLQVGGHEAGEIDKMRQSNCWPQTMAE